VKVAVAAASAPRRGGDLERWLALVWRTAHLGAVVGLGAALLGAPLAIGTAAAIVLASGALLLGQDLWSGRLVVTELAGAVVVFKLLAAGWVSLRPEHALPVFWGLIAVSSLSSHAPKRVRHWSLRGRPDAGASRS